MGQEIVELAGRDGVRQRVMARWLDTRGKHHLQPAHFSEQLLAFAEDLPIVAEHRQFASEASGQRDMRAVLPEWTVGALVGATVQDQGFADGLGFEARPHSAWDQGAATRHGPSAGW